MTAIAIARAITMITIPDGASTRLVNAVIQRHVIKTIRSSAIIITSMQGLAQVRVGVITKHAHGLYVVGLSSFSLCLLCVFLFLLSLLQVFSEQLFVVNELLQEQRELLSVHQEIAILVHHIEKHLCFLFLNIETQHL